MSGVVRSVMTLTSGKVITGQLRATIVQAVTSVAIQTGASEKFLPLVGIITYFLAKSPASGTRDECPDKVFV
jgi:hypothetical protein